MEMLLKCFIMLIPKGQQVDNYIQKHFPKLTLNLSFKKTMWFCFLTFFALLKSTFSIAV